MASVLVLDLHMGGVSMCIRTNTMRGALIEEVPDVLYVYHNAGKTLYSLCEPENGVPCHRFSGFMHRLVGVQLTEASSVVSEDLLVTASAPFLVSQYMELVVGKALAHSCLQARDISHCGIVIPDIMPVPFLQVFVQHVHALTALKPVFLPRSHPLILKGSFALADAHGITTGLHFSALLQVVPDSLSVVGAGIRFLPHADVAGGRRSTICSQLATSVYGVRHFVEGIVARMQMLCYQKLQSLTFDAHLPDAEVQELTTQASTFMRLLYTSLLDGLIAAIQERYTNARLVIPTVVAENSTRTELFSLHELTEVLLLSAQSSYDCVLTEGIMQSTLGEQLSLATSMKQNELYVESLDASGQDQGLEALLPRFCNNSAILSKEFFFAIVQALGYAANTIVDHVLNPLIEVLHSDGQNEDHLPPYIVLWQDPDDRDPLFDIIHASINRKKADLSSDWPVSVVQCSRRDVLHHFLDNTTNLQSSIFAHYTVALDISYQLGQQTMLVHQCPIGNDDRNPSYLDHFFHNMRLLASQLDANLQHKLDLASPVVRELDLSIEQQVGTRVEFVHAFYSPFSQENTLFEMVLRRPTVLSTAFVSIYWLCILFDPLFGLGVLGMCDSWTHFGTQASLVKVCGAAIDTTQGSTVCWTALRNQVISASAGLSSKTGRSKNAALLPLYLGATPHFLFKTPEAVSTAFQRLSRQYRGTPSPWHLSAVATRAHATISLYHFQKDVLLFLTSELHDYYIARSNDIANLFRHDVVYYGVYQNRLCSIFLYDIEHMFSSEEYTVSMSLAESTTSRSKTPIWTNKRFVEFLDATLNKQINADSKHLVRVVDILYDTDVQASTAVRYAAVITEPLFPPLLTVIDRLDDSDAAVTAYYRNVKTIIDIETFINEAGEHRFLAQDKLFYNRDGNMCTMMRPQCLVDDDFRSLPRFFGMFQTVASYMHALKDTIPADTLSDRAFLCNLASNLLKPDSARQEPNNTLTFYKNTYCITTSTPIMHISTVDCMCYHTAALLQALSQYNNNSEDKHLPWCSRCLLSDVIRTNERLLSFRFLFTEAVQIHPEMQKHPAIMALRNTPLLINTPNNFAHIMRAVFVYHLCA